jgi:hypothetical protein
MQVETDTLEVLTSDYRKFKFKVGTLENALLMQDLITKQRQKRIPKKNFGEVWNRAKFLTYVEKEYERMIGKSQEFVKTLFKHTKDES